MQENKSAEMPDNLRDAIRIVVAAIRRRLNR